MVLHHVPSPAKIFEDVAELLQAGGSFFVTDLCSHDQTWVKDACGDLWLGFDPADLTNWANAAGLVEGKSVYLALRNGFRIQVRQFDKITFN
jgi:ArsR family transcriptional regulator